MVLVKTVLELNDTWLYVERPCHGMAFYIVMSANLNTCYNLHKKMGISKSANYVKNWFIVGHFAQNNNLCSNEWRNQCDIQMPHALVSMAKIWVCSSRTLKSEYAHLKFSFHSVMKVITYNKLVVLSSTPIYQLTSWVGCCATMWWQHRNVKNNTNN